MKYYYKYITRDVKIYLYFDFETSEVWDRAKDISKPVRIETIPELQKKILLFLMNEKNGNPVTMEEIKEYLKEEMDFDYSNVTISMAFARLRDSLRCEDIVRSVGHGKYRFAAQGIFVDENDEEVGKEVVFGDKFKSTPKATKPGLLDELEKVASDAYFKRSYEQALQIRKIILDTRKKECDENSEELIKAKINYANSLQKNKQNEEAIALRESIFNQLVELKGRDHNETLFAELNLSQSYRISNIYIDKALEIQERMLQLVRNKTNQFKIEFVLELKRELASTYSKLDRYEEALELKEEVFEYCEEHFGTSSYEYIEAESRLAISYNKLKDFDKAREHREKIIENLSKIVGTNHQDYLSAELNLAATYNKTGRFEEALKLQRHVLKIRKRTLGDEHEATQAIKMNIGETYKEMGEYQKALDYLEEVYEFRKYYSKDNHTRIRVEEKMQYLREQLNK